MNDESRLQRSNRDRTLAALKELIEALDRRVPQIERLGELRIDSEAEALRKGALWRIKQLQAATVGGHVREADLADAVMTDDGGPLHRM